MALPLTYALGAAMGAQPLQEFTAFEGAIEMRLNRLQGDTVSWTVPAWAAETVHLGELQTDVWVRGITERRLRVINATPSWGRDGQASWSVQAVSYKRALLRRLLHWPLELSNIDQGTIVQQLIEHTQAQVNGNWGITYGAVATGIPRDRSYATGDSIGDLLMKLQEVENGLWWWIDGDKVLRTAMPANRPFHATPVVLGATAGVMSRPSVADKYGNAIYGVGSKDWTTPVWRDHPDIAADPRGRWEQQMAWSTVERQDTLVGHIDGALGDTVNPLSVWQVELEPGRWLSDAMYLEGDWVVVVHPGTGGRVVCQVAEIGVSVSADGAINVKAALTETSEEPPG